MQRCKDGGICGLGGVCDDCSLSPPKRVQRKHLKGWRMSSNTISVCRPGKFGNPFLVTQDRTQLQTVTAFKIWLTTDGIDAGIKNKKNMILDNLHKLKGKNLACWCRPEQPCHADILLDLANK